MKQADIGVLDGPVLVFGGPYSNLQATQAVLAEARRLGIGADHVICTGDVVAYCAQPVETLAAIRTFGCAVVAGNCEIQLASYEDNCGCGFEAGTTCDLLSAGWYAHSNRYVGEEDRAWMATLPDMVTFTHQGQRAAVIHGGISDVSRFVWPSDPDNVFLQEIELIEHVAPGTSLVFCGHSGLPFMREFDGLTWINAGVIGMPPNDGAPQTRYAILESGQATLHELTYDHVTAHAAMIAAGLTQGYDRAILSGYWPSEDVLPEGLRASG